MRFYDLFAGIGGFRLGLERVGFTCVGSCEIDKYSREIYKKNFGHYPTHSDVRQVDTSELEDFDILAGGFPCQAFSVAGKRMGFNDTRGTLFFEIARIAKSKRPKILFLENVKGLLNHDSGRTFGTIINTIHELGYDIEWQVINGKCFLPQNRERVFIIGHAREKPTRKIFPIREGNKQNTKQKEARQGRRIVHCIDASYGHGLDNHGQRTVIQVVPLKHLERNQKNFPTDYFPTLDTMNSNGLLQGGRLRKLTPLECERLQGFPDCWTEGVADSQRYKMIGNAVMVPIIEFIGERLEPLLLQSKTI